MFWRYLLLSFLLVVPRSRIFTAATFEPQPDSYYPPDEELIDRLIADISKLQRQDKGLEADIPTDKKDESAGHIVPAQIDSQQGINLEEADPKTVDSGGSQSQGGAPLGKTENAGQERHAHPGNPAPLRQPSPDERDSVLLDSVDEKFVIFCSIAAVTGFIGILMAGVCYYKFRKSSKAATDVEYPAYGVTGPMKERIPSPGDRKLAQSAQMYHYQHQKQQMIAMEKANGDMKHDASDDDSEEDNVEGDYTVYECPGLAPTGEMEVKNPLFRGDETPVTPNQEITSPPHSHGSPHQNGEH